MQFLIFFPVVVMAYFVLPRRVKMYWLLAASYYFYMCWNAKYALLLLLSTFVTYASGLLLERIKGTGDQKGKNRRRTRKKQAVVALSFALNLAILFYFKYFNFALDLLAKILSLIHIELTVPAFDIILPVGISFYTFQALGYTVDVYRDDIQAERNFFRYALFVSFFPQLVAGPIERSKNLLHQLDEPKKFDYNSVRSGLLLMLWGFFLKIVISDRCAVLVNQVYGDYMYYRGFQLIVASVFFAIQIYCDFMGYSVIAKGAAKVLGIDLMDNFSRPYFAVSVKDFWRRWHISLSSWMRDYLYIPLGGNRAGKIKKYRNIVITFLVSGLWHGANVTFLLWGGVHAIYQICEEISAPFSQKIFNKIGVNRKTISWRILQSVWTFILVDAAWVFFRADSAGAAIQILKRSLELSNIGMILNDGLFQLGLNTRNMMILLVALMALLIHSIMQERGIDVMKWLSAQNAVFRYAAYWSAVVLIVFSLDIVGQEFIYFQF